MQCQLFTVSSKSHMDIVKSDKKGGVGNEDCFHPDERVAHFQSALYMLGSNVAIAPQFSSLDLKHLLQSCRIQAFPLWRLLFGLLVLAVDTTLVSTIILNMKLESSRTCWWRSLQTLTWCCFCLGSVRNLQMQTTGPQNTCNSGADDNQTMTLGILIY